MDRLGLVLWLGFTVRDRLGFGLGLGLVLSGMG